MIREIETIRDTVPGFTGVISDLGGPTANMYRLHCKSPAIESACRRPSCVYPGVCPNLDTDHAPLIQLYRRARSLPGVKKVLIASGVRYDLAIESPEYVKELATHHTGGYLKIAPEAIARRAAVEDDEAGRRAPTTDSRSCSTGIRARPARSSTSFRISSRRIPARAIRTCSNSRCG